MPTSLILYYNIIIDIVKYKNMQCHDIIEYHIILTKLPTLCSTYVQYLYYENKLVPDLVIMWPFFYNNPVAYFKSLVNTIGLIILFL